MVSGMIQLKPPFPMNQEDPEMDKLMQSYAERPTCYNDVPLLRADFVPTYGDFVAEEQDDAGRI